MTTPTTRAIRAAEANEDLERRLPRFPPLSAGLQSGFVERRAQQQIAESFAVKAWAVDADGHSFNVDCVLLNMGSTSMYVRMERKMVAGEWIGLVVRFLSGPSTPVAIHGNVLRDDPLGDGSHGIAVAIREHRFI